MSKPDVSTYEDFDQICDRLDQIVTQVRSNDTSLERSLDLFDEAIALGSKAVEMVDAADMANQGELQRATAQDNSASEQRSQQQGQRQRQQPSGRANRKKRGRRR